MKLIPPPHPSGDMPLCRCPSFFQASATYFALDESCSMLYLRLTGSTTLKPKGRYSVPKTWEFPRFWPEVPTVMAASFRQQPKGRWLALFTTFPTLNEVLKTRPRTRKKSGRHEQAMWGRCFCLRFFLFGKQKN